MDKATAENLVNDYRKACYWFKDSCRFGEEKYQQKFAEEMGLAGEKIIEAITQPPDSRITEPETQGEARECWVRFEGSGIGLHAINLADITEYPDEPTDEPGWVQVREIIPSKPEKPLHDTPAIPSKQADPLHGKFPVTLYEPNRIGVKIWDSGEFVFTFDEAKEIVKKLSALINLDTAHHEGKLLDAAKSAVNYWEGADFTSTKGFDLLMNKLWEAIEAQEKEEGKG